VTSKVAQSMESARVLAQGTMEMWVQFTTEEEVVEAEAWMKGKRNTKNLTPLTAKDADTRRDAKRLATAQSLGIVAK
jgi:hypothetical protein